MFRLTCFMCVICVINIMRVHILHRELYDRHYWPSRELGLVEVLVFFCVSLCLSAHLHSWRSHVCKNICSYPAGNRDMLKKYLVMIQQQHTWRKTMKPLASVTWFFKKIKRRKESNLPSKFNSGFIWYDSPFVKLPCCEISCMYMLWLTFCEDLMLWNFLDVYAMTCMVWRSLNTLNILSVIKKHTTLPLFFF